MVECVFEQHIKRSIHIARIAPLPLGSKLRLIDRRIDIGIRRNGELAVVN
ncbi:hypothetical protein ['Paenibacillus yunnanensis' Narsing Rao et al. 2020]|nr:hypothetical protein [Paenibacillus tengchongensis]